jgi:chromatin segregation and condensation protein Rec8/ScpA/Scc1 (kleisin family)
MFLAILEMVKNQAVKLVQAEAFGDIGLARTDRFDEAFPEGEAMARLEEEYT